MRTSGALDVASSRARTAAGYPSRALRAAAWLATALVLLMHAARVARYAVDWPLHDDFTQILAVPGLLAGLPAAADKVALLLSLSVEHRIATLRLAGWLGSLLPGGLDFTLLIGLGHLMLAAAGALVVIAAERPFRPLVALVAALLLTSPTHYGAQYWATGALQHFGVCFFALGALAALARGARLVALAAAVAAALTSANGLMTIPAAVLLLALSGRRREALAWAIAGAVAFAVYFSGYVAPAGRASILDLLREPLRLAKFALATLGGVGEGNSPAVLLGSGLVLAWVAALASGAWRRVPPFLVASLAFVALTCAAIALGRAAIGDDHATLSRYRVYSALAVLLTFVAALPSVALRHLARVGAVAVLVAALLHAAGWHTTMRYLVELHALQLVGRDHFAVAGRGVYPGFPEAPFGDFVLQRARMLGAFDPLQRARPPTGWTAASPPPGAAPALLSRQVFVTADAVSAVVRFLGTHEAGVVWLREEVEGVDGDGAPRAHRALLDAQSVPGPGLRERSTVLHGTAELASLPPGRYRVGYGVENAGAVWSETFVVVR